MMPGGGVGVGVGAAREEKQPLERQSLARSGPDVSAAGCGFWALLAPAPGFRSDGAQRFVCVTGGNIFVSAPVGDREAEQA